MNIIRKIRHGIAWLLYGNRQIYVGDGHVLRKAFDDGDQPLGSFAAMTLCVNTASHGNARTIVEVEDLEYQGENLGNWLVTVERVENEPQSDDH